MAMLHMKLLVQQRQVCGNGYKHTLLGGESGAL